MGVDPSPFTLRELSWMLRGRAKTIGADSPMFRGSRPQGVEVSMGEMARIMGANR